MPGFLPSVHGLPFANRFPPGPTITLGPLDLRALGIGDASTGLCGGMALTALDLWAAGLTAPKDRPEPPANGSRRFRAIVRRQVQSLDWLRVPLRYYDLQAFRPDPPVPWSRALRREPAHVAAIRDEWPRIRSGLDSAHPVVVGLIRQSGPWPADLARNHQVLAFGYEVTPGSVVIRIYDPNHPGHDDVTLRADLARGATREMPRWSLAQSTGEPLLGWFREPYPAPSPASVRAWCSNGT